MEVGPPAADETGALLATLAGAFLHDVDEEEARLDAQVIDPGRALVARDGGRIVASAAVVARELTIPGGTLPAAGVTLVGVSPSHRGRGLMGRMMRRQLADVRTAGEAVAILWASEAVLYGRFGYGSGTREALLDVTVREARVRPEVERLDAVPEVLAAAAARQRIAAIHDAVRRTRPGMLARDPAWWDLRLYDPERERDGRSTVRAAVLADQAYALYAGKPAWSESGLPAGSLAIREFVAASPAAAATLWEFLLGLALVRTVRWERAPVDEPLAHMLTDERAVAARVGDALYVRLVDVPRALAARSYSAPFDVVLDVADDVLPENAGRHRLTWDGAVATCEPATAPAGLELSVADLGAAYLGGLTLEALARAGRVRERAPGALAAASVAFRGVAEPWCPETF